MSDNTLYSEMLCLINSKAHLPLFQVFNHLLAPPTAKRTCDVPRHIAGGYEGMPRHQEKTRNPVRSPPELGGCQYVLQCDTTSIT
jgi:hypothetical protein